MKHQDLSSRYTTETYDQNIPPNDKRAFEMNKQATESNHYLSNVILVSNFRQR